MINTATRLPAILYGADYNPEQWPPSVWDEDMALMQQAGVNIATLPVFGWASLQPDEETFTFGWLDDVLSRMADHGIAACLATATASVPAWVDAKYLDILVVDENGIRRRHGNRHSFCPNSASYRRLSTNLARRIAERYAGHPALAIWHVNNEYGTYCYCEQCAEAFRAWLQQEAGSLDELNRRWYTTFWGHQYTDWSQIEPPYSNGERSIPALRLDYHRFQSDSLLDCYKAEAAILREVTPDVPITTNFMGPFFPLNYRKWASEIDVISWDNYPSADDPPANVAFNHSLMRGLKDGQSFMLMEQSPSQQNWQAYNMLKPPGVLRLQSFQAVAHGAESVMYFQWRRSRGGIEMLHGAAIEQSGSKDRRVYREVAALGAELKSLGTSTLGGRVASRVAILFDWECWWALRFSSGPSVDLDYLRECRTVYAALHALGIQADVVSPDAPLHAYEVIAAPVLYLIRGDHAHAIESQVAAGASFVATYFTGGVDENVQAHAGGCPGPLRRVLGLSVEETDALSPSRKNGVRFLHEFGSVPANPLHSGEPAYTCSLLCDRVILEGAQTLATYSSDFYAGEPAVTLNSLGQGKAYYLATKLDSSTLRASLQSVCSERGIGSPLAGGEAPPAVVEVTVRQSPSGEQLIYLLNHNAVEAHVSLPRCEYTDVLSNEQLTDSASLRGYAVRILPIMG